MDENKFIEKDSENDITEEKGSNLAKFLNNLTQKFNGLDLCDDVRSLEKTTKGTNYFLSLPANLGEFKPLIIPNQYDPEEEIKLAHSQNFASSSLVKNKPFLVNFNERLHLQPNYVKEALTMLLQIEDVHTVHPYYDLYQINVLLEDCDDLLSFKVENCNFKEIVNVKIDEVVLIKTSSARNKIERNDLFNIQRPLGHVRTLEKVDKKNAYIAKHRTEEGAVLDLSSHIDLKHKYDIIICPSRYNFRIQYRALELLNASQTKYIFPTKSLPKVEAVNNFNLEIINEHICENPEQLQAVRRIVNGANPYAPYIIVGPPGTGKTTTIVEAILQIYIHEPNSRILITTSSNSACDTVTLKICEYFENNQKLIEISEKRNGYDLNSKPKIPQNILRVFSKSWIKRFGIKNLNPILRCNSNICDENCSWPSVHVLQNYSMIAVTLSSMGHLLTGIEGHWPFTHIFIDEAGAATEIETLIAITSVDTNKCRVILSGDTKQLGPVVMSKVASKCGLKHSLMERLQACDYYKVEKDGTYDDGAQTRLRRNYRSHPNILQLFNHLYYNDELIAEVEKDTLIVWDDIELLDKKNFPIIFEEVHGSLSHGKRSRSSCNLEEVNRVVSIIWELKDHVELNKIGVISPYRLQCARINELLREQKLKGIEVGTAEMFQGREKHVIIASFVKSNCHLGFVTDPQRLNVILSRAQSLLILVGNPITLAENSDFKYLIEECKRMGTFHKN